MQNIDITLLSQQLIKQIDKETFDKKYLRVKDILLLVGAGAFVTASLAAPALPMILQPYLKKQRANEYELWKQFNIPYLKRSLQRLEKQKLIDMYEENGIQVVKITQAGKVKVIKHAIDNLVLEKPKHWDKTWRLVSYDVPKELKRASDIFREYLKVWKFYPMHESVFLHAYPCASQIELLREYLGLGEYVRIFTVIRIEHDTPFRKFFGV